MHQRARYAQRPRRRLLRSVRAPEHFLRHHRLHRPKIQRQENEVLRVQGEFDYSGMYPMVQLNVVVFVDIRVKSNGI